MPTKSFTIVINLEGESVPAVLTYRRCKNISFRRGEGRSFKISAPNRTSLRAIQKAADELSPRLVKLLEKKETASHDDTSHYFMGELKNCSLSREIEAEEKKEFLAYLLSATRKYEAILDIYEPYKVRLRKMTTRLGTNSRKTHAVTFSTTLMPYDPHIVDSVVVHELAHHFFFDHQKGFQLLLHSAFPDYEKCRKKLLKRDYRWEGPKKGE